jgi:hypothetical protein
MKHRDKLVASIGGLYLAAIIVFVFVYVGSKDGYACVNIDSV